MDPVTHFFGWVCGQNPEHTWSPGGLLLPCCQRCTGLYVGAFIAAGLHVWLKPRLSGRFLEAHGVLLLLMVPFGFHWLAQGTWLRTATGVLFGFGVVTFLWLRPGARLFARATAPPPNRALPHVARTCRFPNRSQDRRRPHGLSVAQIFNLVYRSIGFCGPIQTRTASVTSGAQPIPNRRYGRLQICATWVAALPWLAVSRVSKRADHATRNTPPTWKPAILAPWSRGNSNSTGASESTTPRGEQVWKPALRSGLPRATATYALGLMLTTVLVPATAQFGNARAAVILTGLALGGLLAMAALVVANAAFGVLGCARMLRRLRARGCA